MSDLHTDLRYPPKKKKTLHNNGWSMSRSRHAWLKTLALIRDRLCVLDFRCSPEAAEMHCWHNAPFYLFSVLFCTHVWLEQHCGAAHCGHDFHFYETGRNAKHFWKRTRCLIVPANFVYNSAYAVFTHMRPCLLLVSIRQYVQQISTEHTDVRMSAQ